MLMSPASPTKSVDVGTHGSDVVLAVRDLRTQFFTRDGVVRAVDGISFDLRRGETLCIVGESGCGKSVTALSILGLIPQSAGRIVEGSITFGGTELTTLSAHDMRQLRGNRISMIFQEPMTSLNPVMTVGAQIAESLQIHQKLRRRAAWNRAIEMLSLVRIAEPKRRVHEYPHQLSGGMRQRVMIAMALACNPQVLIADEPTTALDVTIQAQILNLMLELKERLGTAIILITHDLGVVAEIAQRVIVMYAGRIAEEASVDELLRNPKHPYTRGLIGSIPRRRATGAQRFIRGRLQEIAGIVPSLREDISGCAFAPRCDFANERCTLERPALDEIAPGHYAACWELDHAEPRLVSRSRSSSDLAATVERASQSKGH
jgi:peptide/nickel transport system ATP-binding protein